MGFMPQRNLLPGVLVAVLADLPAEVEAHIPWMEQVTWSQAEEVRDWAERCRLRAQLMRSLRQRETERLLRRLAAIADRIADRIEVLRPYGPQPWHGRRTLVPLCCRILTLPVRTAPALAAR